MQTTLGMHRKPFVVPMPKLLWASGPQQHLHAPQARCWLVWGLLGWPSRADQTHLNDEPQLQHRSAPPMGDQSMPAWAIPQWDDPGMTHLGMPHLAMPHLAMATVAMATMAIPAAQQLLRRGQIAPDLGPTGQQVFRNLNF